MEQRYPARRGRSVMSLRHWIWSHKSWSIPSSARYNAGMWAFIGNKSKSDSAFASVDEKKNLDNINPVRFIKIFDAIFCTCLWAKAEVYYTIPT